MNKRKVLNVRNPRLTKPTGNVKQVPRKRVNKVVQNFPVRSPSPRNNLPVKIEADKGNLQSQFIYANMLFNGSGVAMDRVSALQYFEKAANGGHCEAQFHLGDMLMSGWGIPRNKRQAAKYFKMASDNGHKESMYRYGMCLLQGAVNGISDKKGAANIFKKGADLGHRECQFEFGVMCQNGIGVDQSKEMALKYLQMSAAQDFSAASLLYKKLSAQK